MMSERKRGAAEMTGAMVISGTIGLFVVFSQQPVFNVVFWRCLFGAGALLLACFFMGIFHAKAITRRQLFLAILGGLAIVSNWVLLFAAFPRASISVATAVYNTQPFMLVALGALVLGERPSAARLGWLLLAFIGMLAIVQGRPEASYIGNDYLSGVLLALGAAFFYAIAAIITKKLSGVQPHLIALIQLVTGIILIAPFADFTAIPTNLQGWSFLVILGVVHTAIMYILLYGAIQRLPTSIVGSLSFIYPGVALLADAFVFGVRLDAVQMAGVLLVLLAAAGANLGWSLVRRNGLGLRNREG